MEREELIGKLQSIRTSVSLTALTAECALEVSVITKDGTYDYWCGYDDWIAYCFYGIEPDQWKLLREKVELHSLRKEELLTSKLDCLINEANEEAGQNLSDWFGDLVLLPTECPEELYCLYDGESRPRFFVDEQLMENAITEYFSSQVTPWESMDTDELEDIYSIYDEDDVSIPYIGFYYDE